MYRIAIAVVIAGVLGLAGCAKDTTTTAAAPTLPPKATSIPTTPTTTGPAVNERGLISKALGQEAGLGSVGDPSGVTFTIDAVTVDPPCHEYGTKPDSGRTLLMDVRVATGTDLEAATYVSGLLNPYSFGEIGKDGVTRTAQAGTCTDYTKALPSQFGVNQKYAGTIEIVVPEASGVLVLQDTLDNSGGWEWSY